MLNPYMLETFMVGRGGLIGELGRNNRNLNGII